MIQSVASNNYNKFNFNNNIVLFNVCNSSLGFEYCTTVISQCLEQLTLFTRRSNVANCYQANTSFNSGLDLRRVIYAFTVFSCNLISVWFNKCFLQVIKKTGFVGDFRSFLQYLRTDPQFYFKTKVFIHFIVSSIIYVPCVSELSNFC